MSLENLLVFKRLVSIILDRVLHRHEKAKDLSQVFSFTGLLQQTFQFHKLYNKSGLSCADLLLVVETTRIKPVHDKF